MHLQNKSNSSPRHQDLLWCQWFAGIVDSDGCLLLSPKGYGSLEITMSINDEYALQQIKKRLGGSIKIRSKAKAYRYRLHDKAGILQALNCLNGNIRNSVREVQLKKLCNHYAIVYLQPSELTLDSAWFSGFFDGDGTIGFSFKKGWPQLIISVSNKKAIDLGFFQSCFGGYIRLDKRSNTHKWELYKKEDLLFFYTYLKKHPAKSFKQKRVRLIPTFFKLRSLRAYAQKDTLAYKNWVYFERQWFALS